MCAKRGLFTETSDISKLIKSLFCRNSKEHNTAVLNNFLACFNEPVIKKCTNKFDSLVNEKQCIQDLIASTECIHVV